MEHSEYIKLTKYFNANIEGAKLLNWAQNEGKHYFDDENQDPRGVILYPRYSDFLFATVEIPAVKIPRYYDGTTKQLEYDYDLGPHKELIIDLLKETDLTMIQCEDSYYEENTDSANNNRNPTRDFKSLYQAMTLFVNGQIINDRWFELVFNRAKAWIEDALTWFPDLNDQAGHQVQAGNTGHVTTQPSKRAVTVNPDRDKLMALFRAPFKSPKSRPGMEPLPPLFEMFYNSFVTGAINFTQTDFGRVAFQVHNSGWLLPHYRRMTFAAFMRLFFDICGVPVPIELSPNKYKKVTNKTDFGIYLQEK